MLARILAEKGLLQTQFGTLVLSSTSFDDIESWPLVAIAAALARSSGQFTILYTILGLMTVLLLIRYPVKFFLAAIAKRADVERDVPHWLLFAVFGALFSVSFVADMVGITSVLGAFLTGLAVPRDPMLLSGLLSKVEDFTTVILLPLFFAFSGLRTEFTLLNSWAIWGLVLLYVLLAFGTKLLGVGVTARILGCSPWESVAFGVLMSCKGLVALIAANIGLDEGVITPVFFSMSVAMVLIVTFLIVPLSDAIPFGVRQVKFDIPMDLGPWGITPQLVVVIYDNEGQILLSVARLMIPASARLLGARIWPITDRTSDVMSSVARTHLDPVTAAWRARSESLGIGLTAIPVMARQPAPGLAQICSSVDDATLLVLWNAIAVDCSTLLSELLLGPAPIFALMSRNLPVTPTHIVIAFRCQQHRLRSHVACMSEQPGLSLIFLPLDEEAAADREWQSTRAMLAGKTTINSILGSGSDMDRLQALCTVMASEYDLIMLQTDARSLQAHTMAPTLAFLEVRSPKSVLVLFDKESNPQSPSSTLSSTTLAMGNLTTPMRMGKSISPARFSPAQTLTTISVPTASSRSNSPHVIGRFTVFAPTASSSFVATHGSRRFEFADRPTYDDV